MPEIYEHIQFQRETVINERRGKPFNPKKFTGDKSAHAQKLKDELELIKIIRKSEEISGFDDRLLLKLKTMESFDPTGFESIEGITIVSQESNEIVLLFASENALEEFEKRLSTFASTGKVTRKELIEASREFKLWTEEDRKGEVLKREGLPDTEDFLLDIELWPTENNYHREQMIFAFKNFVSKNNIQILDQISKKFLTILRAKCNHFNYKELFKYRDVRTIDVPPNFTLKYSLLNFDIENIAQPVAPDDKAPRIAILDSGISSGHPLLSPSIGDTKSYIKGLASEDESGHGTSVAGIALYGDVAANLENNSFIPDFWIISGRVLDRESAYHPEFIENQIEFAVRELHNEYNCKIFNLSIGDSKRPYKGGKPSSLSMILDNLAHELGVLFIISTGNIDSSIIKDEILNGYDYPEYFFNGHNILEPSNSINSLTVGSIARYDQTRSSIKYPNDPSYQPIAPRNSLSPFSRIGFGIAESIKPELVAYGGNLAFDYRTSLIHKHGLGELSLNSSFLDGKIFSENCGTSFSTPYITNLAGKLLVQSQIENILLIRALLVGMAEHDNIVFSDSIEDEKKIKMVGYGKVNEDFLYKSGNDVIVLYAIESIENNKNHFFELPLPDEFFSGQRKREITITLSYFSPVKNTRVKYRAVRMFFKLVRGNNLEEISTMFDKSTPKDEYKNIPEVNNNRNISSKLRGKGTIQSSTWSFMSFKDFSKYYVVVTRNDFPWAKDITNEYENYVLSIIIKDKEALNYDLYNRISNLIQERIQNIT